MAKHLKESERNPNPNCKPPGTVRNGPAKMPLDVPHRICNCCGEEMDFFDIQEDFTISKEIGYGSKYDMKIIELRLCGDCFDKIVDGCRISPVIGEWGWP